MVSKAREFFEDWWMPVVIVMLSSIILFIMAQSNAATQRRLEQVSTETHGALCTLKLDIRTRYENGREFLEKHPQGIEGISREEIKQSLENQLSTLRALDTLECDD